jgi:tetratricopeptide (TPR) repeat protein
MNRIFPFREIFVTITCFFLVSCQTIRQPPSTSGSLSEPSGVRQETRIDMAKFGRVDPPYPWQAYYHEIQAEVALTLDNPFLALDEVNKALPYKPDSVYLGLLKARILVKVGNLPVAQKTAENLARKHPNRLKPWILLGTILQIESMKQTDPVKKKEVLQSIIPIYREHVLVLDPLKDEAYIALSDIYSKLGSPEKEYAILEEGVRESPQSAYLPFYLGFQFARKGATDKALAYYQLSISRNPRFAPAIEGLGDIYSKKENWELARESYEAVLGLQEVGRLGIEVKLLKTYFVLKKYPEAVLLLKRAIEEHPQNNRLPLILSSILVQESRYDEAIRQIEEILKSHPENPRLLSFLGSVYEKSLHFTRAIATYRLMIRRFPNLYEGSYNLGDLYRRLDNSPKALLYLRDAESLSPERWEIPFSISLALMDQKKYPEALRTLKMAKRLSPRNPILIFNEAILYDQWNHKKYVKMVKRLLVRTLKIDPSFADALNYLGYTEVIDHGDLVKARYDILHALTVDPKNGAYRDSLGWLYDRQGHYLKAFREETKALALMPHDPTVLDHEGRIERHLFEKFQVVPPTSGQRAVILSILAEGEGNPHQPGPSKEMSDTGVTDRLGKRSMTHIRESIMIHPLKHKRVLRYLSWYGTRDKTFIAELRNAVKLWVKLNPESGPLRYYRVDTGDTLQSISAKASIYGSPRYWRTLRRANISQIKNPNDLPWGLILHIPKLDLPVHVGQKAKKSGASLIQRRKHIPGQTPLTS